MKFEELNLKKPVLDAVIKAKYEEPSVIQEKAIPIVMNGDDLIAIAQTGTGKTAAFALPMLSKIPVLENQNHQIRGLVLTPTRELAVQIFDNYKKFGRYLKLRTCCVYGGAPMGPQRTAIFKGCDILIATPGRLLDFIEQGVVDLAYIQMFVLDEADRMLDFGFIHDVRKIVGNMPQSHQTLLFSATMPKEVKKLAQEILIEPKQVRDVPKDSPADTVDQSLIFVNKGDKKRVLAEYLQKEEVKKSIVFTRTKVNADRVVKRLEEVGIASLAIHGDKTQGQRQNALQRFRTNQVKVLVATDVAARGIDIPDITHVFNYELPDEAEAYIHRIGRSGRAGKEGTAISFCCEEELVLLSWIEKLIGKQIPVVQTQYSIELERKKPSRKPFVRRKKTDQKKNNKTSHSSQQKHSKKHVKNHKKHA